MSSVLTGLLTFCVAGITYADNADVQALIAQLQNKDNDIRRAAAKGLGELGSSARSAVPELTRALRDRDLFVRRFAAEALGKIGPDARSSISALTLLLNEERKEVQLAAIDALGKMGSESIQALIGALKDPNKDPAIRRKAAVALGNRGLEARGAVPILCGILTGKIAALKANKKKGNDDDIRLEVAVALGKVAKSQDLEAIEALKFVTEGKQRNRALQRAAADSLRKLTSKGPNKK